MNETNINSEIVRVVNEGWSKNHQPVLLARLGNASNGAIAKSTKELGIPLRVYIETKLAEDIAIVWHSVKRPIIGAVPKTAVFASQDEIDAALEGVLAQSDATSRSRYFYDFWHAFQLPIHDGCKRYVVGKAPPSILNVKSDATLPPDAKEITADDIISDGQARAHDVHKLIDEWISRVGGSSSDYCMPYSSQSAHRRGENQRQVVTLLEALLEAIPEDQMKRVSVPLDLISILHRKKIS